MSPQATVTSDGAAAATHLCSPGDEYRPRRVGAPSRLPRAVGGTLYRPRRERPALVLTAVEITGARCAPTSRRTPGRGRSPLPWFMLTTTGSPKQMSSSSPAEIGASVLLGLRAGSRSLGSQSPF